MELEKLFREFSQVDLQEKKRLLHLFVNLIDEPEKEKFEFENDDKFTNLLQELKENLDEDETVRCKLEVFKFLFSSKMVMSRVSLFSQILSIFLSVVSFELALVSWNVFSDTERNVEDCPIKYDVVDNGEIAHTLLQLTLQVFELVVEHFKSVAGEKKSSIFHARFQSDNHLGVFMNEYVQILVAGLLFGEHDRYYEKLVTYLDLLNQLEPSLTQVISKLWFDPIIEYSSNKPQCTKIHVSFTTLKKMYVSPLKPLALLTKPLPLVSQTKANVVSLKDEKFYEKAKQIYVSKSKQEQRKTQLVNKNLKRERKAVERNIRVDAEKISNIYTKEHHKQKKRIEKELKYADRVLEQETVELKKMRTHGDIMDTSIKPYSAKKKERQNRRTNKSN